MHDLTEARPVTEIVTAEAIYARGRHEELEAILDWMTAQSVQVPPEQQDVVLMLRDCLRGKAHR